MVPVAKSQPGFLASLDGPLPSKAGTIVFVVLGIAGAFVGLLLCSTLLNLQSATKIVIIELFVFFLAAGWLSFSIAYSLDSFLLKAAIITALYLPMVGMILSGLGILFWLTLLLMTFLVVTSVQNEVEVSQPWSKLLVALYAAWVVTGVIVTLGSPKLFGYADAASTLSEFHFLLDARYLLTIVLLLAAFGDAMFKAFGAGLPKLPPSPTIKPFGSIVESEFPALLRPFFVFLNLFVMIVQALVNLVWQLVGLVVAYLYRTAKNLAQHFYDLVTDTQLVWVIGRVVLTFVVVLIFTLHLAAEASDLVLYITSQTAPFSLTGEILVAILRIFLFAAMAVGSVLHFSWMWRPIKRKTNKVVLDHAASGGSIILVDLALSGAVLYVLAKTNILSLLGFDSVGVFTWLFLLLLGSVFVYHLAHLATERIVKERSS